MTLLETTRELELIEVISLAVLATCYFPDAHSYGHLRIVMQILEFETAMLIWASKMAMLVAENLSILIEQHPLLPKNHFGGRPGRSTSDAIQYGQYLVHIKSAWREDKVVSVLFLDVEGAIPNAVKARLIHNLKKRRIPTTIVNFVTQLLSNRKTKIIFIVP